MPYSSMGGVPKSLKGAGLTLSQANTWARYYDEAKASKSAKNPAAIAWMRFRMKHKKVKDRWVHKKGGK